MRERGAKTILLSAIYLFSLAAHAATSLSGPPGQPAIQDKLYAAFQGHQEVARPCVYWWWQGNNVTSNEIVRHLDLMNQAGIGGVLIIPMAPQAGSMEWLSPDWWRMVRFTADEGAKRNMQTEVSAAYAWPSGAKFLKPEHALQTLTCVSEEINGPGTYEKKVDDFLETAFKGRRTTEFVRLVPETISGLEQVTDLMGSVRDGVLSFTVPPGKHTLYAGILRTRARIKSSPHLNTPVLDYFNTNAVNAYLDYFEESSREAFGGKLGNALHGFYGDSTEIWPANWTGSFKEEFFRRRGYDLTPYLHFVTALYPVSERPTYDLRPDPFVASPEFADTLRRVRYDYSRTLVELFRDSWVRGVKRWSNEQGVPFRYQAYGHPWHIGIAENYMVPDIPEGNSWLNKPEDHGWEIWNKYAAAGGHLTGRRKISCEAMTDVTGKFRTSLDVVKRTDDFNFITGMTEANLHGSCYSPADEPPPGRSQFGTFFNEHNTWWPYVPKWAQYNARLSHLFQSADPVVDVGILCPTADVWSDYGLHRGKFQTTPAYGYLLWKGFTQQGVTADYLHEEVLQQASFNDGRLEYGPMRYRLLVLCDVATMEPATAEAVERYVKAGGKLVIVGNLPDRSPSFTGAQANDQRVKTAFANILRDGGEKVIRMESPVAGINLAAWTGGMLDTAGLERRVVFSAPSENLLQVHYQAGDRELFFLSNQDAARTVSCSARFLTGSKTPWRWDAETGGRAPYPIEADGQLKVQLGPSESLLLIFEPDAAKGPAEEYRLPTEAGRTVKAVDTLWDLSLISFKGETTALHNQPLVDFAQSPSLKGFAGVAEYETTVPLSPEEAAQGQVLDLGSINGVSEAWLNERHLGVRWYGVHQYSVKGLLKSGANQLRVKVTTVLYNGVNPETEERSSAGMPGPVLLRDRATSDAATGRN